MPHFNPDVPDSPDRGLASSAVLLGLPICCEYGKCIAEQCSEGLQQRPAYCFPDGRVPMEEVVSKLTKKEADTAIWASSRDSRQWKHPTRRKMRIGKGPKILRTTEIGPSRALELGKEHCGKSDC
ncbi:hypothetical protein HPB52_016056 [Rhipicephalus sanguineus]|uniref:Uncharacterized protein n=1 Tax=Rhipicephalus sanguineus TaxID=34632 RepID=A0A9D4PJS5_RHISA|nr:hypothetical protein HPB52_016056 [Rhipicephalus sanguineus]